MCKWSVCVLFLGFFLNVLAEVTINELSGADTAELGTSISLKCEYQYENETGVEVKWFYNRDVQIVSWIPTLNTPRAIGNFRTVLDVSDNTLKDDIMHSTIRFKELTYNLTGNYTCKVSADDGEDARTEAMVVYQPASSVKFINEESSETLVCSVSEIYPQPNIAVIGSYLSESNDSIPIVVEDEYITVADDESTFNVTKIFKFDGSGIHDSVEFKCNVFIPETNYNEERTVRYDKQTGVGNESTTEYPDYYDLTTYSTVSSIYSTTINSTTINSTPINSTTEVEPDIGTVSRVPSVWLIMMAIIAIFGSKH